MESKAEVRRECAGCSKTLVRVAEFDADGNVYAPLAVMEAMACPCGGDGHYSAMIDDRPALLATEVPRDRVLLPN